jgi:hypothetical protein
MAANGGKKSRRCILPVDSGNNVFRQLLYRFCVSLLMRNAGLVVAVVVGVVVMSAYSCCQIHDRPACMHGWHKPLRDSTLWIHTSMASGLLVGAGLFFGRTGRQRDKSNEPWTIGRRPGRYLPAMFAAPEVWFTFVPFANSLANSPNPLRCMC